MGVRENAAQGAVNLIMEQFNSFCARNASRPHQARQPVTTLRRACEAVPLCYAGPPEPVVGALQDGLPPASRQRPLRFGACALRYGMHTASPTLAVA